MIRLLNPICLGAGATCAVTKAAVFDQPKYDCRGPNSVWLAEKLTWMKLTGTKVKPLPPFARHAGNYNSFTTQASGKSIQKGDIIYLLEGIPAPTVVRLHTRRLLLLFSKLLYATNLGK